MDIQSIRHRNLIELVDKAGSQREFSELTDLAPAFISQLVTKRRTIGEKIARKIEASLKLPNGSLDIGSSGSDSDLQRIIEIWDQLDDEKKRLLRSTAEHLTSIKSTELKTERSTRTIESKDKKRA